MSDLDVALGAVATVGGVGALGAAVWVLTRPGPELVWREVHFPAGLEVRQVEMLLDVLAQAARQPVTLRVDANHERIRFGVAASRGVLAVIERTLAGVAPAGPSESPSEQ